ncbi:hypothetical protein FRB90_007404, partial [Tulasnella sp. 427]
MAKMSKSFVDDINASAIAEASVVQVLDGLRMEMYRTRSFSHRATSLNIDREMDVVAVAQGIFASILKHRMADLRRYHNAMIPINKLPTELLVLIFSMTVNSQTWSPQELQRLASVSARWWRIIVATPSLWATARMFKRPDLALRKSQGLPLAIRVQDGRHSAGDMRRFAAIVGPHSPRWQYVFVQTAHLDSLTTHLRRSLPQLEGLSLGYNGDAEGTSKHLILGSTPKLRHLRLSKITLDWTAVAANSLETLSLMGLRQAQVPKLQDLYNILASSPRLTSLALGELEEFEDAREFEPAPLHLVHLRTLKIWEVGEQTLFGLSKFLRARNLLNLTILIQVRGSPGGRRFQEILGPPPNEGLLSSVIRSRGWKVVYAKIWPTRLELSETIRMDSVAPTPLSVHIQGVSGSLLLLYLGSRVRRGYDLHLDLAESNLDEGDIEDLLQVLDPSAIRIAPVHLIATMTALGTVPSQGGQWFCPTLQEMHLTTSLVDLTTLARALRVRNDKVEKKASVGRRKLSVFDDRGRIFSTKTVSFIRGESRRARVTFILEFDDHTEFDSTSPFRVLRPPMETFAADISSGLAEDPIDPHTIAESAVDAVIDAVRLDMKFKRLSPQDSSIIDVDGEMDVVTVAQSVLSAIVSQRLAALRRQHNAMLSINKLPAELLAYIISTTVHSQTWSVVALWGLASVCSRWWRIIITTPSIWTTARMYKQPQLALKKSKELPVTVRVQDWNHAEGDMEDFMRT